MISLTDQRSALELVVTKNARQPRIFLCSDPFFDSLLPATHVGGRSVSVRSDTLSDASFIEQGVPSDDKTFYIIDQKDGEGVLGWRMWAYYGCGRSHEQNMQAYFAFRKDPYVDAAFEHMTKMSGSEIDVEYLAILQKMRA